jgi:hypothetical protein
MSGRPRTTWKRVADWAPPVDAPGLNFRADADPQRVARSHTFPLLVGKRLTEGGLCNGAVTSATNSAPVHGCSAFSPTAMDHRDLAPLSPVLIARAGVRPRWPLHHERTGSDEPTAASAGNSS